MLGEDNKTQIVSHGREDKIDLGMRRGYNSFNKVPSSNHPSQKCFGLILLHITSHRGLHKESADDMSFFQIIYCWFFRRKNPHVALISVSHKHSI